MWHCTKGYVRKIVRKTNISYPLISYAHILMQCTEWMIKQIKSFLSGIFANLFTQWCVARFVQSKKREKHPWRSVRFSKVAGWTRKFTKSNTPPWVFFMFFKLWKYYQIAQSITYLYQKTSFVVFGEGQYGVLWRSKCMNKFSILMGFSQVCVFKALPNIYDAVYLWQD